MSRFFSTSLRSLVPYVPGEQPRDTKYIKLNTNESPFPPAPGVLKAVEREAELLNLYSDPTEKHLVDALADYYGVGSENVIASNGSDEILAFSFLAFCGPEKKAVFADHTYGFYPVFADLFNVEKRIIPLKDDFTVDPSDYYNADATIVIANPNAPTGIALSASEIESILINNKNDVVIVDEAYVDFGGESVVHLTKKYDNLLVVSTFSKSRNLAGARVGFSIGNKELITDLNTVKYSFNPYNVNRMSIAAGYEAVKDEAYHAECCKKIIENRLYTTTELEKLGFRVLESKANFIFVESEKISGAEYYKKLRERGILVRYFNKERIDNFVRITIGSKDEMEALVKATSLILEG